MITTRVLRFFCTLTLLALALAACDPNVGALRELDEAFAGSRSTSEGSPDGSVSFARDIRPLLARADGPPAGCRRCHYKDEPSPQGFQLGGLDLTTLGALRRGGNSGAARIVVPGDPERSLLVQKLQGTAERGARMPKDLRPFSADEIGLVKRWIAQGAKGSDDE